MEPSWIPKMKVFPKKREINGNPIIKDAFASMFLEKKQNVPLKLINSYCYRMKNLVKKRPKAIKKIEVDSQYIL